MGGPIVTQTTCLDRGTATTNEVTLNGIKILNY